MIEGSASLSRQLWVRNIDLTAGSFTIEDLPSDLPADLPMFI